MNRRLSVNNDQNRPQGIDKTRQAVEQLEAEREARRRAMQNRKKAREVAAQKNLEKGNPGDVDFIGHVESWRLTSPSPSPHSLSSALKICICVRKRPISSKEIKKKDHDSITVTNPLVTVHSAKLKVDGITKYIENNSFKFDHSFSEFEDTHELYKYTTWPLVEFILEGKGGRATAFAYGQTGSGKTYTMSGIQKMVATDIFTKLGEEEGRCKGSDTVVTVSFFELYGGRCQDLLNERCRLKILEDGKGEVVVQGLEEYQASNPSDFLTLVDAGNRNRTTHATEANDTSSRSHAICQILLRSSETGRLKGKLSLVDLAGSERGSDTKSHNRQRRTESSEINKSLLALKECIRALDSNGTAGKAHVPYRASKLTLVLKDCFTSALAKTTMIATVSPSSSSCDHTLNTLRYADRVKEKKVGEISSAARRELEIEDKARKERSRLEKREIRQQFNQDVEDDDLPPPPKPKGRKSSQSKVPYSPPRPQSGSLSRASSKSPPRKERIESKSSAPSSSSDVDLLHSSLQSSGSLALSDVALLHKTVDRIFEEEETLLNLHMSTIQESAELLTLEGKLLQEVQGKEDYSIDDYAKKLEDIIERKLGLIERLSERLKGFRGMLKEEEILSQKVGSMPSY
ncbi:hypothetical protein TrVE_jg5098 [Triparma verrucosa]|uniref:Kinesin-like protein n=2 Tax=Triparma TaxID=722752 RepID=A0A9W7EPL8_9STRA|nr:hypothetical protein TrVE_jg5098 [Triparma verrucosa]GMH86162.1 hypothetical protein TrST_g2030 [Triparma strigata]